MKCPNMSKETAHTAPLYSCTEQDSRKFKSTDEAAMFWLKCTRPLCSLEDIMNTDKRTQAKRLEDKPLVNLDEVVINE